MPYDLSGYASSAGVPGTKAKRGGVNQKRSELKSAVKKAGKKDKGLLDRAKGIADATGLDELANPVMKALSILDVPRAAVVSGLKETSDAMGGGPGFSGKDFLKQTREHIGVGDFAKTGNVWVDRALGFTGDVALDPLTYVSAGASTVATAGARGAELTSKQAARRLLAEGVEKLGKEGAEKAAATALRDGVTALSREELEAIGAKSGARFGVGRAKVNIPGTERVARAGNRVTKPLRDAAKGIGLQDRFSVVPELAKMRRSKNPRDVVHAFLFEDALTNTLGAARGMKHSLTGQLDELVKAHGNVDGETLLLAIEGDKAARVAVPEWKTLKDFFEGARAQASELAGREIPTIEDYAPWKLTRELRDELAEKEGRLGSSAKKVGPERRSMLRAEDAEFAGVELKGRTHAERRAEIEAIAKKTFGDDYKQVLKSNPWELAHAYINDMERYVQKHGLDKQLLERGVTRRTGLKLKEVKKAVTKKGRLEKLAADFFDEAGEATERAAVTRAEIPTVQGEADAALAKAAPAQASADVAAATAGKAEGDIAGLRSGLQDLDLDREALQGQLDELPAAAAAHEGAALTPGEKFATLGQPQHFLRSELRQRFGVDELFADGVPTQFLRENRDDVLALGREVAEKHAKQNPTSLQHLADTMSAIEKLVPAADRSALDAALEKLGIATTERDALVDAAKQAKAADVPVPTSEFKGMTDRQLSVVERALTEADSIRAQGTRSAIDQANARYKRIAEFFNEHGMRGIRKGRQDRLLQTSEDLHDALRVARQHMEPTDAAAAVEQVAKPPAVPKGKLTAAERKVTTAREVVAREQTLFDQAGAARAVGAERDAVAAELAAIEQKIASGETKLTAKVEQQRKHLDEASRLWKEADAHRANGNAALAKVAELEGVVEAAEARAVAAGESGSALLDKAGKIVTLKHSEKAAISDMKEQGLKQIIEGRWGEPWVAEAALQVEKFLQPDEVGRIMKGADQVLARWKAYSLLSPGFHVRNFVGGVFNNNLAGVQWEMYYKYGRAARAYAKGGIEAVDESVRDGFQQMLDHGVIGSNNVRDLADVAPELGRGQAGLLGNSARKVDPTSLDNYALRANRAAAEGVENHLRGTLFLDQWAKHGNIDQALEAVAKYHFDYGMLAPWEQKYARRAIPFYTWSRKNFPLQIEYMLRKPGLYTRYLHAKRNLELHVPEDDLVPEYYADLLAIRSPFTSGKGDRMYFTPDLPFRDLAEQFNVDRALGQLNPIPKVLLETNANKQFFSGLPFKEGAAEAPKAWRPLMAVLAPLGGKFGLPKVKRASDGRYLISDKDAYKIEQTLPLLGRMRRALPSEERYQSRAVTTYLSLIGGVGGRTLDNGQKFGELSRRVKAVQALNKNWDELNAK